MSNRKKIKGFTLLWDEAARARLHRLMALLQKTTPHSVTQSSALQDAVSIALEKLEPSAPAVHSDAPPFTVWPHGEIR